MCARAHPSPVRWTLTPCGRCSEELTATLREHFSEGSAHDPTPRVGGHRANSAMTEHMEASRYPVVVFDLDGTLLRRTTVSLLLAEYLGHTETFDESSAPLPPARYRIEPSPMHPQGATPAAPPVRSDRSWLPQAGSMASTKPFGPSRRPVLMCSSLRSPGDLPLSCCRSVTDLRP